MYQQAREAMQSVVDDMEERRPKQRHPWHTWEVELQGRIEAVVARAYGFTDHPKRELLWEKAYERGHAGGWVEILGEYDTLSELLR